MSTPIESLPRPNQVPGPQVHDPTIGPPPPVLQSNAPENPQLHPSQQQLPPQQPMEQNMMPPQPMYFPPQPLPHHPTMAMPPVARHLPPKPLEEPTLWQMFKDNMTLVIFVFFILLLSQMEGIRSIAQRIVGMTSLPDSMSLMASKAIVALLGSFLFIAGSSYVV